MKTFLKAFWKDIVMVNYEVPKDVLLPYLPAGTELDDFENKHYVSLVGFQFLNSSIFGFRIPFYGFFDEVNLRFYVKRIVDGEVRRGVVFISEIVPNRVVAFLANLLYKEHYSYAKMSGEFHTLQRIKYLKYQWHLNGKTFFIKSSFDSKEVSMIKNSHEEFIYEHYYGYTKVSNHETWEYKVNHRPWNVNRNISLEVNLDFELFYGEAFAFLQHAKPHTIYNAIGSEVHIDWKVNKITIFENH